MANEGCCSFITPSISCISTVGTSRGFSSSSGARRFWPLLTNKPGLQFNGHDTGDGQLILEHAGKLGFEGVVSKTVDAPYAPGNRGLWRKAKWLNRQEFVVVGWSDPEGSRPHFGALLLGYYTDGGKLIYAGRVGTGMSGPRCSPICGADLTR